MDSPTPISQSSKHDRYIVAHATLGSIAVLITMPIALLVGRYLRTWRHWNLVHAVLNLSTVVLIIITFALGNAALKDPNQYSGSHSDVHHKLGLAVFIIAVIQGLSGIGAIFTKHPPYNYVTFNAQRSYIRYVHIGLGITTAALLYAQLYTGYSEWNETSESETRVPLSFIIIFWVLFSIEAFAYLAGWAIMEPLARRRRKRESESVRQEVKEYRRGSTDPLTT